MSREHNAGRKRGLVNQKEYLGISLWVNIAERSWGKNVGWWKESSKGRS